MSQSWSYAVLSKTAKEAGGPEKYVEMIESASRNAGRMDMIPGVYIAALGASILTAGVIKIMTYCKEKNGIKLNYAESQIIGGIKDENNECATEEKKDEKNE